MAKTKAPKSRKKGKKGWSGAIPCMILVLMIFGLVMMLFYWGLKSQ
jgi:hypothetical protein